MNRYEVFYLLPTWEEEHTTVYAASIEEAAEKFRATNTETITWVMEV